MSKKGIRKMIIVVVALVIIGIGGFAIHSLLRNEKYQNAIKNIRIQEVNLETIDDGKYIGEYDVDYISAKVKVTVDKHEIKSIDCIYHNNDRGEKATSILDSMVSEQKIKVDTISGATNSSKVLQKAVELALTSQSNGK